MEDSKKEMNSEKPMMEGFNKFISDIQKNVKNFQSSLEEQSKKGIEKWNENQEKVKYFFQNAKKKLDNQFIIWKNEFKKKQIENKEQWEFTKQKLIKDYQNWQDKVKKDFEAGIKKWNRFWIKSSFMLLLFMAPILTIIIIIAVVINMVD
ncbi:MAG: hypothetical protein KGD63_15145 [Candidatus Lokiarchaeota archaeon]|nr:hypothetical protein [Candidatus Lokiarchaeota archaeon]